MNRHLRTTVLVSAALSAGLTMTACQGSGNPVAQNGGPSAKASSVDPKASGGGGTSTSPSSSSASSSSSSTSSGGGSATSGGGGSTTSSSGASDKTGYGQGCGANDISWSTRKETQAGGYILVIAKAKPGITCVLPGGLPTVSFGSDGTQAKNAEQVAGDPITLRAGVTAYAGVKTKTTKGNGGKQLSEIILSVGNSDPNPVSLKVGTIVVDQPIVTDWHTSASQAVPFGGTDQ
jgi:hypothetical protein